MTHIYIHNSKLIGKGVSKCNARLYEDLNQKR